MCAINGCTFKDKETVLKMNSVTAHRGPDATGLYVDDDITLGHNRLSIIDLDERSAQPMETEDVVVSYNGEIYNFRELRKELSDYSFRTEGDTEVIIAAYKKWGIDCVEKFRGMFAIALWDRQQKKLFLIRDHAGIKPLYYYWDGKRLIFSSEIKGLLEHDIERKLNLRALSLYMHLLFMPGPETFFENIYSVPAANYLEYKDGELSEPISYWKGEIALPQTTKKVSPQDVYVELQKSMKRHLISDRLVGVYLSGGIDSSAMLHLAHEQMMSGQNQSQDKSKMKTFSVGFDLDSHEEPEKFNADILLAQKTADHYGADHHEIKIKGEDVPELFAKAMSYMDQPISNPTMIPMITISEYAKQHVAVVLGGDGADEIFGGYERYRKSYIASTYQKNIPSFVRSVLAKTNSRFKTLNLSGEKRFEFFMFQHMNNASSVINSDHYTSGAVQEYYADMHAQYYDALPYESVFMEIDRRSWLVDQALVLADQMSMASGLEQRVPFLDRDVIDFSLGIPLSQKISMTDRKKILKEAFRGALPDFLFSQPKRGWFSPGAKWLRRPEMQAFVKEALSENYYDATAELFNWDEIRSIVEKHISGEHYNLHMIWALTTFQVWAKQYKVKL